MPTSASDLNVLVAPDSFKGSATAAEVARSLAAGWSAVRPDDVVRQLPMADGGEGTLDAFGAAVPGAKSMPVTVRGPDDREVVAHWLLLPDGTGVVELAATSGLTLLDRLRPADAHTRGFGEAIRAALDHGVSRLLLALGGSSSTDGGTGALTALGARFFDDHGDQIAQGNRGLAQLHRVDLSGLRTHPRAGVMILSDVSNPLLGAAGAAAVFGPQKGADTGCVAELEAGLARLVAYLPADPGIPGAGAAGGTAFGLLAWGATLAPGSRVVGEALGLPAAVRHADVVVTGEGRFDAQSAAGKVPDHVATLARAAGTPALLVAGRIDAVTDGTFLAAEELVALAGDANVAMADPVRHLHAAGAALATRMSTASPARSDEESDIDVR